MNGRLARTGEQGRWSGPVGVYAPCRSYPGLERPGMFIAHGRLL